MPLCHIAVRVIVKQYSLKWLLQIQKAIMVSPLTQSIWRYANFSFAEMNRRLILRFHCYGNIFCSGQLHLTSPSPPQIIKNI